MQALDAAWHLLNLLALPALVAAWLTLLLKLFWRPLAARVAWRRLFGWLALAALSGQVAGWVVLGRDGRMGSYGLSLLLMAMAACWLLRARTSRAG